MHKIISLTYNNNVRGNKRKKFKNMKEEDENV